MRNLTRSISYPPRAVSIPNLHLSLCLKTIKSTWNTSGNLFSGPFQSQWMVLKNAERKNVETGQTSTNTTRSSILNTRSLAALVAITQNVFSARPLDLETPICGLANTEECLYTSYVSPEVHMRPSKLFIIVYTIQRQPDLIFIISISTFSMLWSLVPVYHVLRTGRFPGVQSHLSAKLISSFLVFTHVFVCTKLISNYPCFCISIRFSCGITVWE